MFGFLKSKSTPEAGRQAIRASYDKHRKIAVANNIEPVTIGLFGALGSRYKLRGRFVSDPIHMAEISPFCMMGEPEGIERLADYLLLQELPGQIDIERLKSTINAAISAPKGPLGKDSYDMLIAAVPHLSGSGIQWFAWLTEPVAKKLMEDALKDLEEGT